MKSTAHGIENNVVGCFKNNLILILDVIVDSATTYSCVSCPWVDVWTWLASPHVSHSRFVPEVAYFRIITSLRSILKLSQNLREFYQTIIWSLAYRIVTLETWE